MAIAFRAALEQATVVARKAGELLRADLHRPGGWPIDVMEIAERLLLAGECA